MECPRCKNSQYWKDGFVGGRQRYQCRGCKFRYTVQNRSTAKSLEVKKLALDMYTEGLGFRAIGRILKISYMTVYKWVRSAGKAHSLPIPTTAQVNTERVIEIDEIHTYIQSKKTMLDMGCR